MPLAHRSRQVRGIGRARHRAALCGALLAGAALIVPTAGTAQAEPTPTPSASSPASTPADASGDAALHSIQTRMRALYNKAEQATTKYNALADKLDTMSAKRKELARQIAAKKRKMGGGKERAGALAREQYRNQNLGQLAELLAGKDPNESLGRAQALRQGARSHARFVKGIKKDRKALAALEAKAAKALSESLRLAAEQKKAKVAVDKPLADVEKLITPLSGEQLDRLAQLEKQRVNGMQADYVDSGALGKGERRPSEAGRRALAFAFDQLGEPYLWGGTGPDAFDCSGLTSKAWLAAGRGIQRTSEQQWSSLKRIPMDQIRPGDLVVYYSGASHIGMYVGKGTIIHAPRTGSVIHFSPVASMPILGAVRPDADAPSVPGQYKVPAAAANVGNVKR